MDEKSKKFTSRNSRINLSHTLAVFKPKQPISILAYSTYYSKNNNILHHI